MWLALTLESKTGYAFLESDSPRPMRCKFHVAGGVSIRCCLHHRRNAIPKRLIKKFPRASTPRPGGMVRSIPCIVASDATPFCHKRCKIGSSTCRCGQVRGQLGINEFTIDYHHVKLSGFPPKKNQTNHKHLPTHLEDQDILF